MPNIMIAGAGKIGRLIACLLADCADYEVHLVDIEFNGAEVTHLLQVMPEIKAVSLDVNDNKLMHAYLIKHKIAAVISSLPYFLNTHMALAAKNAKAHYFDLTEDIVITQSIKAIAKDAETAFVPQCGLAPGFISIVASSLMDEFDECVDAKLRVGALPQRASNALRYSLTWSTDGLINQYGNTCYGIEDGRITELMPLEGLESLEIDGSAYEAFNTSGGLGSFVEQYKGKIQRLNYKTIRYPGHCEKMRFLMNDLKLNDDRDTLKRILERAIPKTRQDMILVYVSVSGIKHGELIEKNYVKKLYPKLIRGIEWSAIQVSTSSGVCAVVDLMLTKSNKYRGLITQKTFKLADVLANRFGQYFGE
ncbi:MAG: saccharopine dehydrogenase C-terminal domain-containing protein [Legionellaceae bacterium]|nr:saccharopine dehydrogenase C-terminal domain-containing protein [Legionellaceae bacterium]